MNEKENVIDIRKCKEKDLKEINRIELKNFPSPWPLASFKKILEKDSVTFLVAAMNDEILGYLISKTERDLKILKLKKKKTSHLLKIAVRNDSRRIGIGSSLMNTWKNQIKTKGIKIAKLEVRVQNKVAKKFYLKRGFKEKNLLEKYYPDGGSAIVMKKEVQ